MTTTFGFAATAADGKAKAMQAGAMTERLPDRKMNSANSMRRAPDVFLSGNFSVIFLVVDARLFTRNRTICEGGIGYTSAGFCYTNIMETAICNVRDIDAGQRRWIEAVVGQPLQDHQQVMIQVIDVGVEPDLALRNESLAEAKEIARRGRENAARQNVTEDEVDAALKDAKRHLRSR
ncbi:MAG TPA: hypothetical protein VFI31_25715 [Pirellulales bacterium]|nr:hypothetical protein [Pirellulales bacterium]